MPRPGWDPDDRPAEPARQSGVLVLFYPHRRRLHLPLILRPTYDGAHSGQIAFPGGGREEGDADVTATALREAQEEVGIPPAAVQVLGTLTQIYIRPSNYEVYPTVGRLAARPAFQPNPREVAPTSGNPAGRSAGPGPPAARAMAVGDRSALVPFYAVQGQTIWGATAMILSELFAVMQACRSVSAEFG